MANRDEELFSQALDNILSQVTDVVALLALKRPEEAERDLDSCREFFTLALHAANSSGVNPLSQQRKIIRILDLAKTADYAIRQQKETWWSKAITAVQGLIVAILSIAGLPIPESLLLEYQKQDPKRLR
jgi:hypothetical protein